MARKLEAFPEGTRTVSRYPWDEWLDGDVWELVQGEDYTIKSKSLRSNGQVVARKMGGRMRCAEFDGGKRMVIQFIPGPDSPRGARPAPARTPEARHRRRPATERDRARLIRTWARGNGWPDLSEHGRLPDEILEAYGRASGETPSSATVHHIR